MTPEEALMLLPKDRPPTVDEFEAYARAVGGDVWEDIFSTTSLSLPAGTRVLRDDPALDQPSMGSRLKMRLIQQDPNRFGYRILGLFFVSGFRVMGLNEWFYTHGLRRRPGAPRTLGDWLRFLPDYCKHCGSVLVSDPCSYCAAYQRKPQGVN